MGQPRDERRPHPEIICAYLLVVLALIQSRIRERLAIRVTGFPLYCLSSCPTRPEPDRLALVFRSFATTPTDAPATRTRIPRMINGFRISPTTHGFLFPALRRAFFAAALIPRTKSNKPSATTAVVDAQGSLLNFPYRRCAHSESWRSCPRP